MPVDKKIFEKMRSGEIKRTCPKCNRTFKGFTKVFNHFTKLTFDCALRRINDDKIVEPSPDMVRDIKIEGEKLR